MGGSAREPRALPDRRGERGGGGDRSGSRRPAGQSGGTFNDVADTDPEATLTHIATALRGRGLAYLHLVGGAYGYDAAGIARGFHGPLILNGGYDAARAEADLAAGRADLIAFGSSFLANPDLPERLRTGAAPNAPDAKTFYGGDARGYTDYPYAARTRRSGGSMGRRRGDAPPPSVTAASVASPRTATVTAARSRAAEASCTSAATAAERAASGAVPARRCAASRIWLPARSKRRVRAPRRRRGPAPPRWPPAAHRAHSLPRSPPRRPPPPASTPARPARRTTAGAAASRGAAAASAAASAGKPAARAGRRRPLRPPAPRCPAQAPRARLPAVAPARPAVAAPPLPAAAAATAAHQPRLGRRRRGVDGIAGGIKAEGLGRQQRCAEAATGSVAMVSRASAASEPVRHRIGDDGGDQVAPQPVPLDIVRA